MGLISTIIKVAAAKEVAEKALDVVSDKIAKDDIPKGKEYCRHCGKVIKKGSKYCPKCGKATSEKQYKAIKPQKNTETKDTKNCVPKKAEDISQKNNTISLEALVCPRCYAPISVKPYQRTVTCEYCDSIFYVNQPDNAYYENASFESSGNQSGSYQGEQPTHTYTYYDKSKDTEGSTLGQSTKATGNEKKRLIIGIIIGLIIFSRLFGGTTTSTSNRKSVATNDTVEESGDNFYSSGSQMVEVAGYRFCIPSYWKVAIRDDYEFLAYDDKENPSALLYSEAAVFDAASDEIIFYDGMESELARKLVGEVDETVNETFSSFENETVSGTLLELDFVQNSLPSSFTMLLVADEDRKSVFYICIAATGDNKDRYTEDFLSTLNSIQIKLD